MSQTLDEIFQLVEKLNENELHTVYHFVGEKLDLFKKVRTLYAMKDFHLDDRVSFVHNGMLLEGTVTRLNQKSVSVRLNNGNQWTVHPTLLRKIIKEK
jgi:hypothetical protein